MENIEVRNRIIENVKKVIAAPSCCAELKAVCEEWLSAVDTDAEKEVSARLVAELEEDVCALDDVIVFFESEDGARILGRENAAAMAEAAHKSKEAGGTICICPACQAGAAVLADRDALLA